MLIPIVVVAAIAISLEAIVVIDCLAEDGSLGLFTCELVIVDFIPQDLPLEKKIELVIAEAEGDPDKTGQNYSRLAIYSDLFSHEEKLLVIEKLAKELNTPIPFTENVITGKREFESEEPITFTWKQFGIGNPCPDVAIQVQSKSSDKPFYEHELTRLCQVLDEDVAFLQTWTQADFPDFPRCAEWGESVIRAENQFGTFVTLHEYMCKGPSVATDVVEPDPNPIPELDNTLTEITCLVNQLIYNNECVYVLTSTDEFPKGTKKYFRSIDDNITAYCELEIAVAGEHGSAVSMDSCLQIFSYTISNDYVIEFEAVENEN
jgi:hypothetical protein